MSEKVKTVVVENDKLSRDISILINKEQQNDSGDSHQPKIIENLKMQLNLIATEKDYAMQLWQNAIAMIDHLEEELKTYQESKKNYIPKSEAIKVNKISLSCVCDLHEHITLHKFLFHGFPVEKRLRF